MSRKKTLVATRAPASRQTRAAARQLCAVAGVAGPNRQLLQALRVCPQGRERCECGPAARERGDCCGPRPRDPIPGASAS